MNFSSYTHVPSRYTARLLFHRPFFACVTPSQYHLPVCRRVSTDATAVSPFSLVQRSTSVVPSSATSICCAFAPLSVNLALTHARRAYSGSSDPPEAKFSMRTQQNSV